MTNVKWGAFRGRQRRSDPAILSGSRYTWLRFWEVKALDSYGIASPSSQFSPIREEEFLSFCQTRKCPSRFLLASQRVVWELYLLLHSLPHVFQNATSTLRAILLRPPKKVLGFPRRTATRELCSEVHFNSAKRDTIITTTPSIQNELRLGYSYPLSDWIVGRLCHQAKEPKY